MPLPIQELRGLDRHRLQGRRRKMHSLNVAVRRVRDPRAGDLYTFCDRCAIWLKFFRNDGRLAAPAPSRDVLLLS